MKWSWRICRFRGIGVFVHATVLILIGIVVLTYWPLRHSVSRTFEEVAFVLALFACVVLHEFGNPPSVRRCVAAARRMKR